MAQYFFTFEDTHPDRWPYQCEIAASANGSTIGANVRVRKGGGSFFVEKTRDDVWNFLPFGFNVGDVEALLKMRRSRPNSSQFFNAGNGIFIRGNPANPINSCYYVAHGSLDSNIRTLSALKRLPTQTTLATNATALETTHTSGYEDYWTMMRVRMVGSTLQARTWWSDSTEPSTWSINVSDGSIAAGEVGILLQGLNSLTEIEFFSVGTHNGTTLDSAPSTRPGGSKTVSGVITDDTGTPSARIVRGYHRGSGVLLAETTSNSTTGGYSLAVPSAAEIDLIVLDDDTGTLYNDLIDRVIPA